MRVFLTLAVIFIWKRLIDVEEALKQNFLTAAFEGSEGFRVSQKCFSLLYEEMNYFWQELVSSLPPKSSNDLLRTITLPKGVCRKASADEAPPNESTDLLDCEDEKRSKMMRLKHFVMMKMILIFLSSGFAMEVSSKNLCKIWLKELYKQIKKIFC